MSGKKKACPNLLGQWRPSINIVIHIGISPKENMDFDLEWSSERSDFRVVQIISG